ncbi:CsbD family protein [Antarcticirhabdus aurantiaca]|uniref:CsbD family protein n=1 Tax=Antarcticirhabdus aurantiaca TaxID=2606717 RepID=A0ACD4NS94_9HYPH|nr:CsbD family protein [Antarcticirhabdus aurantiaca]WAJ29628.1 CsbD family protein [Jeongeuplla avenae]
MDKDRIEGARKQVVGSVKEAVGKLTGNERVEAEGAAEKTAGKVQDKVGESKDSLRDAFRK